MRKVASVCLSYNVTSGSTGGDKKTHNEKFFEIPMFSASKEFFDFCKLCGPETIKHMN